MNDLIEKLEKAEAGSREMDALIAVALRSTAADGDASLPEWADENFPTWRARPDGRVECVHTDGTGGLNWRPARFSTSLDAALALVPEGWGWQVSDRAPKPHAGRAYIHNRLPHFIGLGAAPNPAQRACEATAATPALALCIAILKAKEA